MDITQLFDIIQTFDAQSAQAASEHSGLIPWILSALGLSDLAWHRWVAKGVDPDHALLSGRGTTDGSFAQHPDYSDTRLSDLFAGQESAPEITLSDVVEAGGGSSSKTAEDITLSDVIGQ